MSVTLTQLGYAALRDLGCLRAGQTASNDVLNDILFTGNQMLDSWLLDERLVFCDRIDAYALTAGVQFYLIGPGATPQVINGVQYGAFNATRPTRITAANIILNTITPVVRTPVKCINTTQWMDIAVQQIPFAIPLELYYDLSFDPANGWSRILLWPGPLASYQLELATWQQLTSFASLTQGYIFPPGYQKLIQKKLAIEIAPSMSPLYCKSARMRVPSESMLAEVRVQAKEAEELVASYNAKAPVMEGDPAFHSTRRRAGWNYALGL